MAYIFLGTTLVIAAVDWVAVDRKLRRLEYFAKPATMVALLAWLLAAGGLQWPLLWFALGLLFSLAGDVFLMLPKDRFLEGLLAFLLAHVMYIFGFSLSGPITGFWWLPVALLIVVCAGLYYRRLAAGMQENGIHMKIPVLIYSAVISIMVFSAITSFFRPGWNILPALLCSLGALLFFLSDSTIAWTRFIGPLPRERLLIMFTYHLGQVLIISGVILRFVN